MLFKIANLIILADDESEARSIFTEATGQWRTQRGSLENYDEFMVKEKELYAEWLGTLSPEDFQRRMHLEAVFMDMSIEFLN